MLAARHSQHALEFVWKDFNEAPVHFVPVVENPLRSTAAGQFHVPGNEISKDLHILSFQQRLEIDRIQIAALFRKVTAFVEDISDTAAHARGKIPTTRAEDE